jgi:hypothetical protein
VHELTPEIIARSRVIAKGRRIRDVERLMSTYGGQASRWVKKSSPLITSDEASYEYHWYEYYGLGRFEIKVVRIHER